MLLHCITSVGLIRRRTGDALGWEGLIRVDGITYEWMGIGTRNLPRIPNLNSALPTSVYYDSQYSNFTFNAGPIELVARFFSPVVPNDYCRTSIPLSYLTVETRSLDKATHDVTLYSHVDGSWASFESNATLQWDIYSGNQPMNGTDTVSRAVNVTTSPDSIYTWVVGLEQQYLFGENTQFPEYGNFTFSTAQHAAQQLNFSSGHDIDILYNFTMGLGLNNMDDSNHRGWGSADPAYAYAHHLGPVGSDGSAPIQYTLGNIQLPSIRFLDGDGLVSLNPWWSTPYCYGSDIFNLIDFHFNDLNQSQVLGAQYEAKLKSDVDAYYQANSDVVASPCPSGMPPSWWNGTGESYNISYQGVDQSGQQWVFNSANAYGFLEPNHTCYATGMAIPDISESQSYYSLIALAARQVMAAYVLTERPNDICNSDFGDPSTPVMFQKEISSSGNVNTVDITYPAMPFFLYSDPALLRFTLEPLFFNEEGGFYPNDYSMHDLGTNFPNATGHVEGNDEYMPVEESGNMILMTLAYYKFSNDAGFLREHYPILEQWAQYLIEYSLVPEVQLSTDDFAGQLANQTNLTIKGIVGLQAMSQISAVVDNEAATQYYANTAHQYYTQWQEFAIDPSERHTILAYQFRSSWSLLYNIYPDKLLNLGIIPQSLYDMQSTWYPEVSQVFGVPLDSRHSYTKSDWEMWTAATCSPSTRALFVNGLAYWLNNTYTDLPFTDLYQTIGNGSYPSDPEPIEFIARPVQGGLFSLLALEEAQPGMVPS